MLILIEFNELCPSLLERFMEKGGLPNFRKFHDESLVCTTDAQEEPPNLEPWIQWPTLHSGLPFAEHGVFHLGDGRNLRHQCLAEILSDAGVRVGVCGSMNLNYRELNGYLLPDPWDKEGRCSPDWLEPFYRTVSRQVQESSCEQAASWRDLVSFGWFLVRNGLTLATARDVVRQLVHERLDSGIRWRRACLLDAIQYDVFRRLNRRLGIQFASFFANSTAHFQHYYWRNMQPEAFAVPPPETDHPSLRGAIAHGYRRMDALLGRFLSDYPDAVLVLASALSQQPWKDTTKCTYRPASFELLLDLAGIPAEAVRVMPVMAEEFHVECADEASAERAEQALAELTLDDEPLMKVERRGRSLFTGCRATAPGLLDRAISNGRYTRRLGDFFHMVHGMRSGRHHPDGVLWIRGGVHRVIEERVPLTAVAPTILSHFGVAPPARMEAAPLAICPELCPA